MLSDKISCGFVPMNDSIEETCAICLSDLQCRQRKLHTTDCGHVFHETCFEKIKDARLRCPYCRSETKPLIKQQIRVIDHSIKELSEYINVYPTSHKSYVEKQNARIQELEEMLKTAKQTKRIVITELSKANKYNKEILENHKLSKRILVEKQREEMEEFQRKRAEARNTKKTIKITKGIVVDIPSVYPDKPLDTEQNILDDHSGLEMIQTNLVENLDGKIKIRIKISKK
jgi:hypothetical protein